MIQGGWDVTHGNGQADLSELEVALLGLLSIQPMTGYDIGRYFDRALAPFWTVPRTQIYPRLKDLEERGLVASEHVVQESKPNKRIYELTGDGLDCLRGWLRATIHWVEMRHFLLMKVFLGNLFAPEELQDLMTEYRTRVESWSDELRKVHEKFEPSLKGEHRDSVFFQLLSLEHLIAIADLEVEGTDRILEAVEEAEMPLKANSEGTNDLLEIIKEHFG